jgi:hypothetical protein
MPVIGSPVTYNLVQGSVAIPRARGDEAANLRVTGFYVGGDPTFNGIGRSIEGIAAD